MNINDMERMISLTDEKYLAEMFSEKIKKSHPVLKIASCVAFAAAAVIGIFVAVNIPESDNADISLHVITENASEENFTSVENYQSESSGVKEETEKKHSDWQTIIENTEYTEEEAEEFFPNKCGMNILLGERENFRSYYLPNEYVEQILPFDISDQETADGHIEFDYESDRSIGRFTVGDKQRSMELYVGDRCYNSSPVENYVSAERYGVTVYGFDIAENIEEYIPHTLMAFWESDGFGYSIAFQNYDPADALKIMDSLILSGFSLDDADLDQAESSYENKKISLSEANNVEYFAGHVPQAVSIAKYGTLYLSNNRMVDLHRQYDKDGVLTRQDMDLVYFSEKNTHYLRIYYDTDHSGAEVDDHAVVLPEDMSLEFIEENANVSDIETHDFVIDYGDFIIGIYGDCDSETLWEFLKEIL